MATSAYPGAVKSFGADLENLVNIVYAAHVNDLRAEVVAVETEIGLGLRNSIVWANRPSFTRPTNPNFAWGDLSLRLNNIEAGLVSTAVDVHPQYFLTTGGSLTGPINMGSNKISGLANGTVSNDAVNFGQLSSVSTVANNAIATANSAASAAAAAANAANAAQTTANSAVSAAAVAANAANAAQTTANSAVNNANGRVAKSGDEMTGPLWTPSVRIGPHWSLERDGNDTFTLVRFSPNGQQVESFPMTITYSTGFTAFAHLVHLAGGAMFSDATVPEVGLWSGQDQCRWMLYDGTGRLRRMSDASFISMIHYVTSSSSRRFKTDITEPEPIDVTRLQPRAYRWRATEAQSGLAPGERLGLIAEEVAEVDERLVTKGPDDEVHGLDHSALIAALIAKVTELQSRIETLEASQ